MKGNIVTRDRNHQLRQAQTVPTHTVPLVKYKATNMTKMKEQRRSKKTNS
jgi:hypothetical protein